LSLKTKVDGLSVVWPQNHWDGFSSVWASKLMATVCEWFGLETTRTVFIGLASKLVVMVSGGLASKPAMTVFTGLASKPVAMVFSSLGSKRWRRFLLVWPQNQWWVCWLSLKTKVVEGFLVWASKLAASVW
jgi:hypothetical protein